MYLKKHERHFLCPKPRDVEAIPVIPDHVLPFSYQARRLGPPERRAMRELCENGDVLIVGGEPYLLSPLSNSALDALAAFEVGVEDAENDLCDEPDEGEEDDSASDKEYSLGGLEMMNQAGWAVGGGGDCEQDKSDEEPWLSGFAGDAYQPGHLSGDDREEEHDYWPDGIPPEGAKKSREAFIEAWSKRGES